MQKYDASTIPYERQKEVSLLCYDKNTSINSFIFKTCGPDITAKTLSNVFVKNSKREEPFDPRIIWDFFCANIDGFPYSHALNVFIIPKGMFEDDKELKSFVCPDTIQTIQENAFKNSGLEELEFSTEFFIPQSDATNIESGAFEGCPLREIVINVDKVKPVKVATGAFDTNPGVKLKRLVINGISKQEDVIEFFKGSLGLALQPLLEDTKFDENGKKIAGTTLIVNGKPVGFVSKVKDSEVIERETKDDSEFTKSDFTPTIASYSLLSLLNSNDLRSDKDYWTFGWQLTQDGNPGVTYNTYNGIQMGGENATEKLGVRAILSLGKDSQNRLQDYLKNNGNKREAELFQDENGKWISFIVINSYSIVTKDVIAEVEAFDEATNEEFINYVKNIPDWEMEALKTNDELPIPDEILKKSPAAVAVLKWWDSIKG